MRFAAFAPVYPRQGACPRERALSPFAPAPRNPPTSKNSTSSRPAPCASPSTSANAATVFIVCAALTPASTASTTSCPASGRDTTPIATWFPLVSNAIRSKASVPPPIFSAGSTASAASPSPNSTTVSAPSTPSLPASSCPRCSIPTSPFTPLALTVFCEGSRGEGSSIPTPPSAAKAAHVFSSPLATSHSPLATRRPNHYEPLPLAGFQTFGDTLRSGRRRIHETTIECQDAGAIPRLTPRRSCEDDRDGARTREQAHSAWLRGVPRLGHHRLDHPPVSISTHLQQAADLLRRHLVAEELLLALPDGRVLECESAPAVEGGVQGGGWPRLNSEKRLWAPPFLATRHSPLTTAATFP